MSQNQIEELKAALRNLLIRFALILAAALGLVDLAVLFPTLDKLNAAAEQRARIENQLQVDP